MADVVRRTNLGQYGDRLVIYAAKNKNPWGRLYCKDNRVINNPPTKDPAKLKTACDPKKSSSSVLPKPTIKCNSGSFNYRCNRMVVAAHNLGAATKKDTWYSCKDACAKRSDCRAWQYNPLKKECQLKRRYILQYQPNFMVGRGSRKTVPGGKLVPPKVIKIIIRDRRTYKIVKVITPPAGQTVISWDDLPNDIRRGWDEDTDFTYEPVYDDTETDEGEYGPGPTTGGSEGTSTTDTTATDAPLATDPPTSAPSKGPLGLDWWVWGLVAVGLLVVVGGGMMMMMMMSGGGRMM